MARAWNVLAAAYSGGFGVASEAANGGGDMVLPPGRADSKLGRRDAWERIKEKENND
jgi:hypothetical protein